MIKLLHTSDLGLKNWSWGGRDPATRLNKGFLDAEKAFAYVVTKAIEENCNYCVIAGDINEERNPEALLIQTFSRQIKRLVDSRIHTIVVAGNHDLDGSYNTSTSISYLDELKLDYVHIIDKVGKILEFDDVVFHCLPYFTKWQLMTRSSNPQEWIEEWLKDDGVIKDKVNVFVAHYAVENSFEGLNIDEIKLPFKYLKLYDYVALGHIHKYEMFDKFDVCGGFSGSPYIKDFGENNDKFFNIVTFDKEVNIEKQQIPSREFLEIEVDAQEAELKDVLEVLNSNFDGELKEKIVKVRIITRRRFNPKPIYDFLRKQEVFHYVPIHWDFIQLDTIKKIGVTTDMADVEIVKNYLSKNKVEENRTNKILTIHNEIKNEIRI